jgi:hypothetical protein
MVGSDHSGTEVGPSPDPSLAFAVHQELITKNGIFTIENLALEELARDGAYELLFVFTPVHFKGATGSPGRPLAIRRETGRERLLARLVERRAISDDRARKPVAWTPPGALPRTFPRRSPSRARRAREAYGFGRCSPRSMPVRAASSSR